MLVCKTNPDAQSSYAEWADLRFAGIRDFACEKWDQSAGCKHRAIYLSASLNKATQSYTAPIPPPAASQDIDAVCCIPTGTPAGKIVMRLFQSEECALATDGSQPGLLHHVQPLMQSARLPVI